MEAGAIPEVVCRCDNCELDLPIGHVGECPKCHNTLKKKTFIVNETVRIGEKASGTLEQTKIDWIKRESFATAVELVTLLGLGYGSLALGMWINGVLGAVISYAVPSLIGVIVILFVQNKIKRIIKQITKF